MKKAILFLFISIVVCVVPSQAAVLWTETFDWLSTDWSLDNDQDGSDGHCPAQIYSGHDWPNCDADTSGGVGTSCVTDCVRGDSEAPDIKITTAASRTGISGDRGFRMYINPTSCGTCDENGITDSTLWPEQTNFYLRWYMRFNFTTQTNYKKIFRLKNSAGSQRFILDMLSNGRLGLYTSADSFNDSNENLSWDFNTDYTPNTWTSFEIYINQTNDEWTLWVDGEQKGSPVAFAASNSAIAGMMLGGNQCGTAGSTHIIDFDDLVVSTTYVGPEGEEADTTAPSVTISTSNPSAINTNSLTITGTASDAVGVSSCKYRLGSAPTAEVGTECTGTTSWSCSTSGYASGANTMYVGCDDEAGNWGSNSITVNYTPATISILGVTLSGVLIY